MFSYLTMKDNFTCCSLSSVLVARLGRPFLNIRLTARLKAVTLVTGVVHRVVTLLNTPLFIGCFNQLSPVYTKNTAAVSAALPIVAHCSKGSLIFVSVFRKVVMSFAIPFFISFFYSF